MTVDVSTLTKSLLENNASIDRVSTAINSSLMVIANIFLLLFFLMELASWHQFSTTRGGKLPMKIWGELTLKYLICWFCMTYSAQLLDGLMWLLNAGSRLVLKDVKISQYSYQFDLGKAKGVEKIILNLIGGIVSIVANGIILIISVMRFMELYFLKGIASLFIACLMNEVTRPIAINFIKYFSAVVLTTLALTVISILYPVLFSKNLLLALMPAGASGAAIISIFEGLLYIIAIIGSSRKMQRIMGV